MTIEEITSPTPNALATGPFGSAIGSRYFVESGVPVIRGGNLSQEVGNRLIDDGLVFVTNAKAAEFGRSLARRGDLVFTCWGTIDQVGLIDERSKFAEYIVSNKQMKFTPDSQVADSLFLYYLFSSPMMREQILSQGIGSSIPGFNLGQLRKLSVALPSLSEQRAIARILGSLDDKIELNRQMNGTLEEIARALFKSWFVDFDPVRAKVEGRDPGLPPHIADLFPDSFEDSELGEIPKRWRVVELWEVIDVNPPRSLKKGDVAPYLGMAQMPTRGHSPDVVSERQFGSGTRFVNGDTLVARITPCLENGKTAFVDFLRDGQVGWGSTEYFVFRPKPTFPDEFAYCLARSGRFREFAIQNMTGTSGRQRVPASALAHFHLVRPSDEVARQFGSVIKPLFTRARAAVDETATLSAARDTLLQKLISGELRANTAEQLVEEIKH